MTSKVPSTIKGGIQAAGITFGTAPPNGFARLLDESRETWNEVKRFIPPKAELAAVFVTTDDMALILLNERPQLAEYIAITTFSDANRLDATATRTVFAAIRKQFQSQTPINLENVRQINKRLESAGDVNRTIGGTSVVDYFDFGQDTFGLVMLVNQTIDDVTLIRANCSAVTLIQNRIVQVTTTRVYSGRDDISDLKNVVKSCIAKFK